MPSSAGSRSRSPSPVRNDVKLQSPPPPSSPVRNDVKLLSTSAVRNDVKLLPNPPPPRSPSPPPSPSSDYDSDPDDFWLEEPQVPSGSRSPEAGRELARSPTPDSDCDRLGDWPESPGSDSVSSGSRSPSRSVSRAPSPDDGSDFLDVWPEADWRPYPADTTIPLFLRPNGEIPEDQIDKVKSIRRFKRRSSAWEGDLRVETLDRRYLEDIDDYIEGVPLTFESIRESRSRIVAPGEVIHIRPIWVERAREMRQFFEKVDLEHAKKKKDQLLLGDGVKATGSSGRKRGRDDEELEKEEGRGFKRARSV